MNSKALAKIEEIPEPLSQQDYERLKEGFGRYRDLMLCKLLRATGLRISEVLGSKRTKIPKRPRGPLTPAHLSEDGPYPYLLVQRAKREKQNFERVYLPVELGLQLRDYVRGNNIGAGDPIFKISHRQVENVFAAAGGKALGRRVKPHELRGLYIKTLLDGGVPVVAAAKMVGHASSKTTERWYYELTREQRAEIQRRIPV